MRAALAAALALALCAAALAPSSDAGEGAGDAAVALDAAAPLGACEAIAAGIERRKAWLAARRQEQFVRGRVDPKKGVPNMVHVWCEAHPDDEDCRLGNAVVEVGPDELEWIADAGPDEYEGHVLAMKRALKECRQAGKRIWP